MNFLKKLLEALKKDYILTEDKKTLLAEAKALSDDERTDIKDYIKQVEDLPEKTDEDVDKDEDDEIQKGLKTLLKKEAGEIANEVKADIKKYIEEQKDLSEKKAGVYNPDVAEKRKELSNQFRELTKSMLSGDTAKLKELTSDATGSPYAGYTIGEELSAEIRLLITQYGVARREMTSLPLTKGSYKANNLTTDVTVYWVDEGAAISSTQAVLGQEELTLKKLGAIVSFTSELLEDTEIDFIAFIASRVAEAIAKAEDLAFFNGDGTSTYGSFTGLLQNASVNEVVLAGTTFASLDADDLLDAIDATPSGALANGKFYYHRSIKSLIRKLKDSNNAYIYQPISDRGPATVWGYPEALVEVMPTASDTAVDTSFILFGDLRTAAILGYKASGLTIDEFNAGTIRNVANSADINLITTDRKAVRFTERTGYMVIVPTAVTKITTAPASA